MIAASYGRDGIVKLLLDHGANPNSVMRKTKLTPLHLAASNGFAEVCKLLLSHGALTDMRDSNGLTGDEYAQMSPQAPMIASKRVEEIEAADGCLTEMRMECREVFSVF